MKKTMAVLLAMVLALGLFGCGAAGNNANLTSDALYDVTAQELVEKTGMDLAYLADRTQKVTYNVITASTDPIAEAKLVTVDGVDATLRVKPVSATAVTEMEDFSGLNYKWTAEAYEEVAGREAWMKACSDMTEIHWLDVVPGVGYYLSVKGNVNAETMIALAEELFVPMQGDADGIDGMANPNKYDVTAEEVMELTGLDLTGVEKVAQGVVYNALTPDTDPMAEAHFTAKNGWNANLRVKAVAELDIHEVEDFSGLYYVWSEEDTEVSGKPAVLRTSDEYTSLRWLDAVPGIAYDLAVEGKADKESMVALAEELFVEVQGNADGFVGMANPNKYDVTADEVMELTGLDLTGVEKAAQGVVYNVLTPDTEPMAEAHFTANDGLNANLRVKPVPQFDVHEVEDFSGLYYSWTEEDTEVSGRPAVLRSNENYTRLLWLDAVPGLAYDLAVQGSVDKDTMVKLAEELFVPVQGDADADPVDTEKVAELMDAVYGAAPGTAGSSLRTAAAAAKLLDYSEEFGTASGEDLTECVKAWLENLQKERNDGKELFEESWTSVKEAVDEMNKNEASFEGLLADAGYTRTHKTVNETALKLILSAVDSALKN